MKDFKTKLFANLDEKARPDIILASSSSGIPSSQFIDGCKKAPERVLIGHPFNPPHLVPLVEVVPHPGTQQSIIKTAMEFYTSLGKTPIEIKLEIPGFVANRLQSCLNFEAMALVKRGAVSAEAVDLAVTSSLGMRWAVIGPLMSNVFGGGGGRDGFLKIQKGIGMTATVWQDDMAAHKFDMTDENLEMVDKSVQVWLDHVDLSAIENLRDDVILTTIEKKKMAAVD
jgi:3-hydroxyacyl-CoA dehydrogenase